MNISLTPDSAGVYAQIFATLLIALAVERFEPIPKDAPRILLIFDSISRALRAVAVLATAVALGTLFPVIGGAEADGFSIFVVYVAIYVSSLAISSWAGARIASMFVDTRV